MSHSPLDMAHAFIQTGELDDALEALEAHLAESADDDEAHRLRIEVLLRRGTPDDLRAVLAAVDGLAEVTATEATWRSVALERLGDLDGAGAAMRAALAANPDDERAVERLVGLLHANGEIEAAQDLVAAMPRTWRWLQWAGDLAAAAGDDMTATARYGLALAGVEAQFDMTYDGHGQVLKARLLLARANAYRRLQMEEQAEEAYMAARKLVPDEPMIPFGLGLLAALRGEMATATTLCGGALDAATGPLRAEMTRTLREEAPYAELARALEIL